MSISFNDDGFGRKVGAITSNWKSDGNMKALKKTMEEGKPFISRSAYIINSDKKKIPITASTSLLIVLEELFFLL